MENVSKNRKIYGLEKLGIPSYIYPWMQVVPLSNMSTFFGAQSPLHFGSTR